MKKTANDLLHSNEEYVKLRNSRPPGVDMPPRETPDGQSPGTRGYDKPMLESWTTDELRELALTLELKEAATADRNDLIDRIIRSNAAKKPGADDQETGA